MIPTERSGRGPPVAVALIEASGALSGALLGSSGAMTSALGGDLAGALAEASGALGGDLAEASGALGGDLAEASGTLATTFLLNSVIATVSGGISRTARCNVSTKPTGTFKSFTLSNRGTRLS